MLDEKTRVFSYICWMLENFQFNFILRKVEGKKITGWNRENKSVWIKQQSLLLLPKIRLKRVFASFKTVKAPDPPQFWECEWADLITCAEISGQKEGVCGQPGRLLAMRGRSCWAPLCPIAPGCSPQAAKSILSMAVTSTYSSLNITGHFSLARRTGVCRSRPACTKDELRWAPAHLNVLCSLHFCLYVHNITNKYTIYHLYTELWMIRNNL
jgi:hypothetical protein